MAFSHGKTSAQLLGKYDVTAYLTEISAPGEIEAAETTTFGNGSKTYIVGLADGTVSLSGLFEGSSGAIDAIAEDLKGDADVPFTAIFGSNALGSRAYLGQGILTSYEPSSAVADVASISAELQTSEGLDSGIILAAARSVATATTTSETGQNNAASTSNGGVGIVHVTANAANNNTVIKIQHSSDNSSWSDLITFTTVATTVTTAERITVSGSVNQYVRATSTTSGAGAVVYTVSFARR